MDSQHLPLRYKALKPYFVIGSVGVHSYSKIFFFLKINVFIVFFSSPQKDFQALHFFKLYFQTSSRIFVGTTVNKCLEILQPH